MRLYLILLLYMFTVSVDGSTDDFQLEGYYWRDYIGKLPKDALPGGINSEGKVTYIGQVLHAQLLIPAEINVEENKVIYEWGYKEYLADKNIRILCTIYPERFEWIRTGNGRIQNVQSKDLINGGYEAGAAIYIGRKQLTEGLLVGKVISTAIQTTLNTVSSGKVTQHAEFDILSYNPNIKVNYNKNNVSCNLDDVDVRFGKLPQEPPKSQDSRNITINFYN